MFRSLVTFVLTSSLMLFCQTPTGTTNNGSYIAPIMPGAPLVTPPNVALPGSGPATGAPVAIGVNDPRTGGNGSVYQPTAGTLLGIENTGVPSPAPITGTISTASETTASPAANAPLNVGVASYSEAPTNQPEVSLGDIARRYKAQRANQHPKMYDNSNIRHASYGTAETNAAELPQGDQTSATYGSTGSANVPSGVKNPADYAAVQAALARSQAAANTNATPNTMASAMPDPNRSWTDEDTSQQQAQTSNQSNTANQNNAAQQSTPNTNQSTSQPQSTNEATTPQVNSETTSPQANANQTKSGKQLPASGSSLPLIAMLGLIALSVGGIFTWRTRTANR